MSGHSRFVVLAATLLFTAPLAAQQASLDSTSQGTAAAATLRLPEAQGSATRSMALPALQNAATAYRANVSAPLAMASASGSRSSNDLALMAVGGAGLIVGALIGGQTGTIVMLGSGVIGLVGLFRYLQ